MSKRLKVYIVIFVGVIGLMMYLEYTKPKPLDWRQTYSVRDKIPFGAYVLANELPKLFPEKSLQIIENQTIANFLLENDSIGTDNVFFILNSNCSDADETALLKFAESGNDVFLIHNRISSKSIILDTLNITTSSANLYIFETEKTDTIKWNFSLTNQSFKSQVFQFDKINHLLTFAEFDTAKVVVLGVVSNENATHINFIKQPYGKGNFYIHLLPEAFSNYYVLNDTTYSYAVNCLNYINKKHIIWNDYEKSTNTPSKGLLMYITANPPLHWAWVILVLGAIVYCLFFGKRQQRIIPIIIPLKNSTIEFAKTIGNLYYNSREHNDLIQKKIKYFLFFVKEKYFLDIQNINADFSERLSVKSGVSKEITDRITLLIDRTAEGASEDDLRTINSAIDEFYLIAKNRIY